MTVKGLLENENFTAIALPCESREITDVYIGDLLSWVMGKAQSGNVWITIMSNINTVAVATLADIACILLCEGVTLDAEVKKAAEEKGINVLATDLTAYKAAVLLNTLL